VQRATDVWAAVGCQVLKMSPENHDAAFAAVSHLPHLIAFAYLNAMNQQPAGKEFLSLAGPGFRDFSRIAASDPVVWRDILLSNREEVLKQSEAFRAALEAMERSMRDWSSDALQQQIASASDARTQWTLNSQGPATGGKPPGSR
jgi:prephenate dehydrogenase